MDRLDLDELTRHGYTVHRERFLGAGGGVRVGWELHDPDGAALMIGPHGCVAPTRAAAVAEGLRRVERDTVPL